jgi:hypothetical protein
VRFFWDSVKTSSQRKFVALLFEVLQTLAWFAWLTTSWKKVAKIITQLALC